MNYVKLLFYDILKNSFLLRGELCIILEFI